MKSSKLNIDEKGKQPKPTKKKLKTMVKKFLGISSKKDKELQAQKEKQVLEFEDNNRKVDSSVNQWISSEYSRYSNDNDDTEESITLSESTDGPSSDVTAKRSAPEMEHRPVLSSKLLAQNDIKKKKANKSLTFSRHLADIRLYEREHSWSDTSTIASVNDDHHGVSHHNPASLNRNAQTALSMDSPTKDESVDRQEDVVWEDDSEDEIPLTELSYRQLQKRAKEMNLPANTKKVVMIAAIQEKEAELAGRASMSSTTTQESASPKNKNIRGFDDDSDEDEDEDGDNIFVDSEPDYGGTWHQAGSGSDEDDTEDEDEVEEKDNKGEETSEVIARTSSSPIVSQESKSRGLNEGNDRTQVNDNDKDREVLGKESHGGDSDDSALDDEDESLDDQSSEPNEKETEKIIEKEPDYKVEEGPVAVAVPLTVHTRVRFADNDSGDEEQTLHETEGTQVDQVSLEDGNSNGDVDSSPIKEEGSSNRSSFDTTENKDSKDVVMVDVLPEDNSSEEVKISDEKKDEEECEAPTGKEKRVSLTVDVEFDQETLAELRGDDDDSCDNDVVVAEVSGSEKDIPENEVSLVVDVSDDAIQMDESDVDERDCSAIVGLVDDFNNKRDSEDESTEGDGRSSLINSLVDDFNKSTVLTDSQSPSDTTATTKETLDVVDSAEVEKGKEKDEQAQTLRGTKKNDVADVSNWLDRGESCSNDSRTDLKELMGEVDDDDNNEVGDDDDDDDLTAAIADFLIENHSDKVDVDKVDIEVAGTDTSAHNEEEVSFDVPEKVKERQSSEVEPVIVHAVSRDDEDETGEELDHFEELDIEVVSTTGISLTATNSSKENSNNNFYTHVNPFKDDDSSAMSFVSTDDDRPRIFQSNISSKYSVDSVMGDIVLDDNIIEYDSDIVSQGRLMKAGRGRKRSSRRRRRNRFDDDDSTVLLDDSTAPIPEDETVEVLADEFETNSALIRQHTSRQSPEKQNENIDSNVSSYQEENVLRRPPPIPIPSTAQSQNATFGSPSSTKYFQFADLNCSISTDTMRETLLSLEARLMKVCPGGLHEPLVMATVSSPPNPNVNPLIRNESQTSCHDETDYYNSNVPLVKKPRDLRRIDSNKTFETVSSLGSSDAVDQKRTQILKKHADEKRRQKKHQEEILMHQREARQEARARLKESSSSAIDQALASNVRRGFPAGHVDNGHHVQEENHVNTSHLTDHFGYATSSPQVPKANHNQVSSGGTPHPTGSTFQRAGSYNQHSLNSNAHTERPNLQTNYSTNSIPKRPQDNSELRSATSEMVIDTFKSRTAAALTAKNIRMNSRKSSSSKTMSSHSVDHPPRRESTGSSSRASLSSNPSRTAVPPGSYDIYKPLPPECTISPKQPKISTSRSHSRSRGGPSSNSSIISDNDTCSQYQASVLTSHEDENSSRGSGSLTSTPSSARRGIRSHGSHHGVVAPRTTNAGRMRAAAIKERSAGGPDSSTLKGPTLPAHAPSAATSTFTRTTAMRQNARHSTPSSNAKSKSQHTPQDSHARSTPSSHSRTPQAEQVNSLSKTQPHDHSERHSHYQEPVPEQSSSNILTSPEASNKTPTLTSSRSYTTPNELLTSNPEREGLQRSSSQKDKFGNSAPLKSLTPAQMAKKTPAPLGLSIHTQGLPPSSGKGSTDGSSVAGSVGGASVGSTPSSLVLRARALVESRSKRSKSTGRMSASRASDEEEEKKYNISPVRPAQNPFQSII